MDNLPELRDIHIPNGVSIFPLAYGWWMIIIAIIFLTISYKIIKTFIKNSKKRYALEIINNIDKSNPIQSAIIISETLRRICVYKFPDAKNLAGNDWINFLNQKSKKQASKKDEELLLNAPYVKKDSQTFDKKDISSLANFAKKWIGENI